MGSERKLFILFMKNETLIKPFSYSSLEIFIVVFLETISDSTLVPKIWIDL